MARYIDADKFIKQFERALETQQKYGLYPHAEITQYVIKAIENEATADVVPKSEVDKIFKEIGKILYKYDKIAERDKSEYGELIVGDIGSAIAELKEKYTASTEIVRDLAEYAVDQDIQNYRENN